MKKKTIKITREVEIFYEDSHPEQITKAIDLLKEHNYAMKAGDKFGFKQINSIEIINRVVDINKLRITKAKKLYYGT